MAALAEPAANRLRREVFGSLTLGLGAGLVFLVLLAPTAEGAWRMAGWFVLMFLPGAAWVWRHLPAHAPHSRWGWANRITATRGLALLLWGAWGWELSPVGWGSVALGTLFLLADGVDGYLARRQGTVSPFGARFDLEVDALFVLIAGILLLRADQLGPWVLTAGLLRYGYLLAGCCWPALNRPLPPSRRRAVCGVTNAALLTAGFAPILPLWLVQGLAALGLALVVGSFTVDGRAQFVRMTLPVSP
ncbi:MAG: CDP-alcohol phosphatidyltransferase family protein [Pseudomonadota bacterium]